VKVWILLLQFVLVCGLGLVLRAEGANVVAVTVAIDIRTPRLGLGVIADALDAGLAVAADLVVLTSFLLAYYFQVGSAAIKPIMIEKDDLVSFRRKKDLSVQVAQAVLAIDLAVPDGVALAAVTFWPVAPFELRQERIVSVVNKSNLSLGQWNSLHEVNLLVGIEMPHRAACLFVAAQRMDSRTFGAEQPQ